MDEIRIKKERVRNFLREKRLKGVLLTQQSNFSWITGGGDNFVMMGSELGASSALITENKDYVVTNNTEAVRVEEEEIDLHVRCSSEKKIPKRFKILSHMWYEAEKRTAIIKKICPLSKLGTDAPLPGARLIAGEFKKLRYSLTPDEIKRYQWLGEECGKTMGKVCRSVKAGDTENEIAGRLAEDALAKGIVPVVILIAADDRISRYRHPIPTDKKIKKYVMVVLCGRKWGLIVSLTRLVHFGKTSAELRRRHNAVAEIDACFISGTKPGARVSEIFKCALQVYRKTGFADEWKFLHQGGSTGYEGRDYKGNFNCKEIVRKNQAFAWNPSITGTKSEDTIIAFPEETKIISTVPGWPMITAECCGIEIERPDILVK
jgi:Xaa-Pro dipeptidase